MDSSAVDAIALSAALGDDGGDEIVFVTPTGVIVYDRDGGTLAGRTVYACPAPDGFDAAFGDPDMDGGRNSVVTRKVGDVVTIDVLDVGGAGDASVRTIYILGEFRQAPAVAPPSAGERPLISGLTRTPGRAGQSVSPTSGFER